jgi:predicted esterase
MFFTFLSCSNADSKIEGSIETPITEMNGTGSINFTEFAPLADKPIALFYHIPKNATKETQIVFVFHGNGRNAKDYRDATIEKANEFNFIVIVPEFSNANFPGGDVYNLGNVFLDGDNPSDATLLPEENWTFSAIEPIFDFIKEKTENTATSYKMIGHSAGGQFAHRFVFFKPNARYSEVVASASGWYTVPDNLVTFPYGFKKSPLEDVDLTTIFSKNIYIQVGELDNSPSAGGLRRNQFADAQGDNRYDRAYYFYNTSKNLASKNNLTFNWNIQTNTGLNHDFRPAIEKAVDLLFN